MSNVDLREVTRAEAQYMVVIGYSSFEPSVVFYANKEDLEWALQHSWFDSKSAVVGKVLDLDIKVKE